MGNLISLKQGESKEVNFSVRVKATLVPVDLSGSILFLGVKRSKSDASYLFSKSHSDFTVTDAPNGIVSVLFSESDTNQTPGLLIGELKVVFVSTNVEKSDDLWINIEQAVTS